MDYVKNLDRDEMRSGFLVTSSQKRVWNTQINLLMEFARICEKYNLKWFAAYGTLIGAARHRGFIPWDADVDVVMLRPDYDRFMQIAPLEIRYPYFCDLWYENDDSKELSPETWPLLPFIKLRDLRTTSIEYMDCPQNHQYIAIDVMPLDPFPPFGDEHMELKFREIYELYFTACRTKFIREELAHPTGEFMLGRERIQKIYDLPLRKRGIILEKKAAEFYFDSKYISTFIYLSKREPIIYEKSWFDETIYLPFEGISVPAPKEFAKMLEADYGDWRKIKIFGMYSQNTSIDIPYEKFLEQRHAPDDLLTRSNSLRSRLHVDEFRNGKFVNVSKKKIWKVQLEIVEELKRVCEKLNLKFWAKDSTLLAAWQFHGFNPEDDILTFEMTREDFEKLEFEFPYLFVGNLLMDRRTTMVFKFQYKEFPQGIFIYIFATDNPPEQVVQLPFEFTSIPVPKNYEEVLRNSLGDLKNARVQRLFKGVVSADISHEEFFSKFVRAIIVNAREIIDLENSEN
ncbi:MAG: LicD family protein [Selenomonadaceae bacterium]|nr:LicD family protein [Selenomonadaceae bacterium]